MPEGVFVACGAQFSMDHQSLSHQLHFLSILIIYCTKCFITFFSILSHSTLKFTHFHEASGLLSMQKKFFSIFHNFQLEQTNINISIAAIEKIEYELHYKTQHVINSIFLKILSQVVAVFHSMCAWLILCIETHYFSILYIRNSRITAYGR